MRGGVRCSCRSREGLLSLTYGGRQGRAGQRRSDCRQHGAGRGGVRRRRESFFIFLFLGIIYFITTRE